MSKFISQEHHEKVWARLLSHMYSSLSAMLKDCTVLDCAVNCCRGASRPWTWISVGQAFLGDEIMMVHGGFRAIRPHHGE